MGVHTGAECQYSATPLSLSPQPGGSPFSTRIYYGGDVFEPRDDASHLSLGEQVDTAGNRLNGDCSQRKAFIALTTLPCVAAVDILSTVVQEHSPAWCNPPWSLIPKILKRVSMFQCKPLMAGSSECSWMVTLDQTRATPNYAKRLLILCPRRYHGFIRQTSGVRHSSGPICVTKEPLRKRPKF